MPEQTTNQSTVSLPCSTDGTSNAEASDDRRRSTGALPGHIAKPIRDTILRGNRYNAMLKRRLSPAKRRHALHRLHQTRVKLDGQLASFMAWGISTV